MPWRPVRFTDVDFGPSLLLPLHVHAPVQLAVARACDAFKLLLGYSNIACAQLQRLES